MKFFKDSIREIKHVVWPTRKETKKYFIIVVTVLVLFGLYLFLFSNLFSRWLSALKSFVSGNDSNYTDYINLDDLNLDPEQLGIEILTWDVEDLDTEVNVEETEVVSSWEAE